MATKAKPKGRGKPKTKRVQSRSAKIGRPTRCTPEIIAAIEEKVKGGMGREAAARQAGIGVATFHEWMARGAAGDQPYAEFSRRIEAASDSIHEEIATVYMKALRHEDIRVAAPQARWMGERLLPTVYGTKQDVRLSGPDGDAVKVEHSGTVEVQSAISPETLAGLTPEQLEALGRGMAGKEGSGE